MTIYQKIAGIQKNLLQKELPKSGYNKFGNFKYHELEDILPTIFRECYNQELFIEFSFTNELAQLKIRNWNKPGESVITSVPMPEIVHLNRGMNIMQSEGSYITYLKRYLLINMFLIVEKVEAPGAVQKIREYIHKKDSSLEITPSMINTHRMKLFKDGKLTKAENKEAYNWFKNQEKEVAV